LVDETLLESVIRLPEAGISSHEQPYFGGGVESEAEQRSDRIDVPWSADGVGQSVEESVHDTAFVELVFQLLLVE
jgi:hypothetical protein